MFPLLFILVVIPSTCEGQHENPCNVFPKDQYIEVGSSTTIVCQTSCVHGEIFWTLNNERIDKSVSNTINSSHTDLSLRNFTHRTATLQCHSEDTQQVLGGTTIRTYSKPSKISCVFYYSEPQIRGGVPNMFKCSWEHQIDSSLEINYTLLGSSGLSCEICNSHVTTCSSTFGNASRCDVNFIGNATVTVRAKTAAWEAYSDPYTFNLYHILKIIPPKLTKITTFSDHLLVEWNRTFDHKRCHCQVKYSKVVNERTPEWVLNKTLNPKEQGNVTIEKVESCTNYTFAVRCALDKAPWSDWSYEKTVLTKLNKSDVKLRLWRKVAEPDKNGVRKVHVMWTEIPSTCQDTFTYTINQTPCKEDMTGGNYMVTLCGNSTCEVDVNQGAHRINLTVFHNETLLVEDSVYVPAAGETGLPQVTGIQTSTREGIILVSWKAPVQPVSGYMIDCTHDGNQYYWKESKYTNATLFDLLDKKPYNITVTPLIGHKTGHGAQALQICSRLGDPGNVSISVQAYDKSAYVSFHVSQEACSGAVVNYTVFYSTHKGPLLNVTADSTTQGIYLNDLNTDTEYSVCVKATAPTGTAQSETHFKTKRFDPRLITALSVCGSILIILVLSLGLYCSIQWNKFKEKPVPNPGLSSVALWQSTSHQKAFSNPSESPCDRVYTEEAQKTSDSPLPAGCNGNPAGDQTEEYTDPATVSAAGTEDEDPVDPVETQHPSPSGESTALLSSDNGACSPYRSQISVETPAPRTGKQCKHVPVKQQEKTAPVTVYITLDMFEKGEGNK